MPCPLRWLPPGLPAVVGDSITPFCAPVEVPFKPLPPVVDLLSSNRALSASSSSWPVLGSQIDLSKHWNRFRVIAEATFLLYSEWTWWTYEETCIQHVTNIKACLTRLANLCEKRKRVRVGGGRGRELHGMFNYEIQQCVCKCDLRTDHSKYLHLLNNLI